MSASNVRLYQIVKRTDESQKLDIKGLAVKEKEFVISHIEASKEYKEEVATLPDNDPRRTLNWQPENTKTEGDILVHFADLLENDLHVWDAVKGEYLSEAVAPPVV